MNSATVRRGVMMSTAPRSVTTRFLSCRIDHPPETAATRGHYPRVAHRPVPTSNSGVTMSSIRYVTPSLDGAADDRSLGAEAHPGLAFTLQIVKEGRDA